MDIMFKSTRGDKNYVTASQAIVHGIANDGGLFVPETIPTIDFPLEKITEMSYPLPRRHASAMRETKFSPPLFQRDKS